MFRRLVSSNVNTLFTRQLSVNLPAQAGIQAREFCSKADEYDSTAFAHVPEFNHYFSFSSPEKYKPAVINTPSVRFICLDDEKYKDTDMVNPKYIDAVKNNPKIFVSDSLYRTQLNCTNEEYKLKTLNYGELNSRVCSAPFYGIGGCISLELCQKYKVFYEKKKGVFIFIDHVNTDTHVKLIFNKLYEIAYPGHYNAWSFEMEILKGYREEGTGKLLRNPKDKQMDYLPYVSAIVDSDRYHEMISGKKVENLYKGDLRFDYNSWFKEQSEKAAAHKDPEESPRLKR